MLKPTGIDSGVMVGRNVALSGAFALALHLFPRRKLVVAAVALPVIGLVGAERGRLAFRVGFKEEVTPEKVRTEALFLAVNDMVFHSLDMVAFLALQGLVRAMPRAHALGRIAAGIGTLPCLAWFGVRIWGAWEEDGLSDVAWLTWGTKIMNLIL